MLKGKDGLEDNRTISKIVMTSSRVRDKNNVTYTDRGPHILSILEVYQDFYVPIPLT